jgi:hypothetical protein
MFNTIAKHQWVTTDANYGEANFQIDGKEYNITFEKEAATHFIPEHWSIIFALITTDSRGYQSPNIDMTGTGHEFEVMSTVKALTVEWFTKHPTKCVILIANTPGRKRIYSKMLKQVFPQWKIGELDSETIAATDPSVFRRGK